MTETTTGVRHPAAPEAAGPSLPFRPDIEGLRAVAVVLVVLFHAGVPGVGGGSLGVDVFLVVSGFLITSLMMREIAATGRLSLLRFCCRRARRVLPASALVLVAVVLAGYQWLGFRRGDEIAEDATWAALFAADLRFAGEGVDHLASRSATSLVQHFWPVAVAEQFSLLWPVAVLVLLWLGFRWALAYWLTAAVLVSFGYSVWAGGATGAYFSPATRAWELGAGCLLALAGDRIDRIPVRLATVLAGVGTAVIVVAALTFDATTSVAGHAAAIPVLATVLVLAGRGDALLGRRPLRWLGRLSYPLYLWHWPVLVLAEQAYGGRLPGHVRALLVLLSVGLAALTYLGLEDPIRRSRHLQRSPLLTVALAVLLIMAPLAVARWKVVTSPAADAGEEVQYQPRLGAPVAHVPH